MINGITSVDCAVKNETDLCGIYVQFQFWQKHSVFPQRGLDLDIVYADEIDSITHSFPLCMSLLHNFLRETHRLSHFPRVMYYCFAILFKLTILCYMQLLGV